MAAPEPSCVVFPDRKCANPNCKTPDKLLKPHEQLGPDLQHPLCWNCYRDTELIAAEVRRLEKEIDERELVLEVMDDVPEDDPQFIRRVGLETELCRLRAQLNALKPELAPRLF